jgi:hypothetical protein
MPTVDVTCPSGVAEGDTISVSFGDANFNVALPAGVIFGDTFAVEIPEEFSNVEMPALPVLGGVVASMEARGVAYGGADILEAALMTVLDATEDHDDPRLDDLVDRHCDEFADYEDGDELPLHWTQMHEDYVAFMDDHIGGVLSSLDCSAEDVFLYAQAYSSGDERIQRLIMMLLATTDVRVFCAMMRGRHEILGLFG